MMMMGSEEGSQPPDSAFYGDYSQDIWLSVDEICGENGEPDSKDGLSHEEMTPNTYEGFLDGAFESELPIAAASCEVGEDALGILSGDYDTYAFPINGSEAFPFVEDSESEFTEPIFGEGNLGLSENCGDHATGNEQKDLHSYLRNGFHNVKNHGRVTNDISITSMDVSTTIPGAVHDTDYSHHDEMTSTSRIELPSVNGHQSFASGSTFTPDAPDRRDDDGMEPEGTPPYLPSSAIVPQGYSASLYPGWQRNLLGSEYNSVFPLHSVKAEVDFQMVKDEVPHPNPASLFHDYHHKILGSEQKSVLPLLSMKAEGGFPSMGNEMPPSDASYSVAAISQKDQVKTSYTTDDDCDLCILEDMSTPIFPNSLAMDVKPSLSPKMSRDPTNANFSYLRPKPNDERVIFRQAMEDLAKPRSEASPPDGLLSVSLLKHQRIALSWMVSKETKGAHCSGGILADDQGLGKTISTIALILKERPPSSKFRKNDEPQIKTEMLNLEEDDAALQASHTIGGPQPCNFDVHLMSGDITPQSKGRPSGGTLIVCPTSVLRQWSDELQNKVTNEANLSILVYYGSNRAKDPCELAMYDVVITTYSIVSMEVPKQPVVGEKNDPQEGRSCNEVFPVRKRKSSKTCKQSKKGKKDELNENVSGPLAKVRWFRVVLDEAQSIKNFRTKTARACWGLRAKRRWCLSGTPIQNSIDDLYSYFRFLRHEKYSEFRTFSEQLRVPIQRNPQNGYENLQAVLRTIMLRRTKDSCIDGEPIINLPPKIVELKRIDFSQEERSFYDRLEVESQAEFAKFAESGTVKENYVNILLMLLRLRQACDHPLLVGGFQSILNLSSSIDMAKSLSQERQNFLWNCLEDSLALCGICGDPPEDAVVTTCGHVFCNQCISEHILGTEAMCPSKKCKTHLNKLSVFSKMALRGALAHQPNSENDADCSGSDISQVSNSHPFSCPEDSSKIQTALRLLLSMSQKYRTTTAIPEEENAAYDPGLCDGVSVSDSGLNYYDSVQGGKAIVFSQWTRMLDLLEDCLKRTSIQYRRLDGTMPVTARDKAVKDFNNLPQVTVMIMSLKAASLGLNMVAACNVLLLDLWWNPTTEDQAIDRAHRIGQTRPVSVFRLTVKNTVEDRILALQERKRKMVESAFGEHERGSRQTRLTMEDLRYLFGS